MNIYIKYEHDCKIKYQTTKKQYHQCFLTVLTAYLINLIKIRLFIHKTKI